MCGIAGVSFAESARELGLHTFRSLLVEAEERGKDATGLVYMYKDKNQVYKGTLTGTRAAPFVTLDDNMCGYLGHTRSATTGTAGSRNDIHPFVTSSYIGVHNGTIFNWKHIQKKYGLPVKGATDSEVIFRLMDLKGIEGLKELDGTFCIAFVNRNSPGTICLLTNGSKPMHLVRLYGKKGTSCIGFGSTVDTMLKLQEAIGGITTEDIIPGVLYKIRDGVVRKRNKLPWLKLMTAKEGYVRYFYDFLVLNRDYYLMAIPASHQLMPGEKKSPPATATLGYTGNGWSNGRWVGYGTTGTHGEPFLSADRVMWLQNAVEAYKKMFLNSLLPTSSRQEVVTFFNINYMSMISNYHTEEAKERARAAIFDRTARGLDPKKAMHRLSLLKSPTKDPYGAGQLIEVAPFASQQLLSALALSDKVYIGDPFSRKEYDVADLVATLFVPTSDTKEYAKTVRFIRDNLVKPGILEYTNTSTTLDPFQGITTDPQAIRVGFTSANYFQTTRVAALIGHKLTGTEEIGNIIRMYDTEPLESIQMNHKILLLSRIFEEAIIRAAEILASTSAGEIISVSTPWHMHRIYVSPKYPDYDDAITAIAKGILCYRENPSPLANLESLAATCLNYKGDTTECRSVHPYMSTLPSIWKRLLNEIVLQTAGNFHTLGEDMFLDATAWTAICAKPMFPGTEVMYTYASRRISRAIEIRKHAVLGENNLFGITK